MANPGAARSRKSDLPPEKAAKLQIKHKLFQSRRSGLVFSLGALFLLSHPKPLSAQLLGAIPSLPSVDVTRTEDGLTAKIGDETLRLTACQPSVIHVVASPKPIDAIKQDQPWMLDAKQSCPGAPFQFSENAETATLTTSALKVELSLKRGNLKYSSIGGDAILTEGDSIPRTYDASQVNGESVYHVADRFRPDPTEGFYGLGQHQSGMFNYRGSTVELGQNNTDVAIPLLVSSKGYATFVEQRFIHIRRQSLSPGISI